MIRRLCNLVGWHKTTVNWALGGLRILAIMALALVLAGTKPSSLAQAAPASMNDYVYSVSAYLDKGNATICVGDNVTISTKVERIQIEKGSRALTNIQKISGIWVEGLVQDPSIGKLLAPTRKLTGWNSDQPGIAVFAFHADKSGTTTLNFKAEIHYYKSILKKWIYGPAEIAESNPVDVTVVYCDYKVTAVSRWSGFGINYTAIIHEAEMTANAQGAYTGTDTMNWVITNDPPCPHTLTPTSQADLTGSLDADGQQLVVDLAYQPVEGIWYGYMSFDCTQGSWNETFSHSPAPLTFSVPASGGSHKTYQVLVDNYSPAGDGDMSGSANVFVERVTNH
ncbi:MAG: hypothetical protein A2X25_15490 [Chloroflexi bacterium GWB2_49_20]|nr:MAG: hypothetical protein A2X25_15490 [Chloroflexi bacterium GWB2_49_20]OGN77470.1 MAG: hypothetical protein A2X26_13720 [Chloroflexi bacterium GWC2_49_37]OGN84826.1 MAG: hypothetical protein A2X27_14730 [Chloroflexi bacterium GWD2_49_16]HCC79251.1 hypothetical protein [Anaerolineae bacterium]